MKQVPPRLEAARLTRRVMKANRSASDGMEESEAVLLALAQAIELRDRATSGHCERLALFSLALGAGLGLGREALLALYQGAYLHDIGKVGLPDAILFKRAPLNETEWKLMRQPSRAARKSAANCARSTRSCPSSATITSGGTGRLPGRAARRGHPPAGAHPADSPISTTRSPASRPYKPPSPPAGAPDPGGRNRARLARSGHDQLFLRLHPQVIAELSGYVAKAERRTGDMEVSLLRLGRRLLADAASGRNVHVAAG